MSGPRGDRAATGAAAEMDVYLDRPMWRMRLALALSHVLVRCFFRLRVEGMDRYPAGAAVVCFNHLDWFDPFAIAAAIPASPPMSAFGPKEADMTVGTRNRLMSWLGVPVPYHPAKDDLIGATRRVDRVLARGRVLFIAGEGRIHVGERQLLPLSDGPAYFALRAGVPLYPLAVNGTGWLGFGRTVRVRLGEPILPEGRPTSERVAALTAELTDAMRALVADFPDRRPPGRAWRWFTELFNDWPEGERPALPGTGSAHEGG